MTFLGQIVIALVTTLTYPTTDDVIDTFTMDLACNLDPECEITITRDGESHYGCQEDEPCWDCATMGNLICGPVSR